MEEKSYKLLKDYGDFYEGDIVSAEELKDDDIAVLLEEGVVQEFVEAPKSANLQGPAPEEAPAPAPAPVQSDELVSYKVTGPIAITDGQGQTQGHYPIGSIHKFTKEVGDAYVTLGSAEEVVE